MKRPASLSDDMPSSSFTSSQEIMESTGMSMNMNSTKKPRRSEGPSTSTSSSSSSSAQKTKRATTATPKDKKEKKTVEIRNKRVYFQEKKMDFEAYLIDGELFSFISLITHVRNDTLLTNTQSYIDRSDFKKWRESLSEPATVFPNEFHSTLAKKVQESDKDLDRLTKEVKAYLCPTGFVAENEDGKGDMVPNVVISEAICRIATRKNYGIIRENNLNTPAVSFNLFILFILPETSNHYYYIIKQALCIWRWEVNDLSLLPPVTHEPIQTSRQRREEARVIIESTLTAMTPEERDELFAPSKKRNTKTAGITNDVMTSPSASGSASVTADTAQQPATKKLKTEQSTSETTSPTSKSKKPTPLTKEEEDARVAKQAEKDAKAKEKQLSKEAKEREKAEKLAEKQAKDAEKLAAKAAKEAVKKQKEEELAKKQQKGALFKFFARTEKETKKKEEVVPKGWLLFYFFF